MSSRLSPRFAAGLAALVIWALLAASALLWWLRAGSGAPVQAPVAGGAPPEGVPVDARAVARALGAPESEPAAAPVADIASRLALRGVVTHDGRGAALIAVDGKPPTPVRVGAALAGVDGGWTLRSVTPHAAVIASGDSQARLEMPPLDKRSSAGDAVAPVRAPLPPQPRIVPGGVPPVPGVQGAPQGPSG